MELLFTGYIEVFICNNLQNLVNKGFPEAMAKAIQNNCMGWQLNQNQKNGKYKGIQILEPLLRMSKEEFSQFKKARKYRCIKRSSYGRFGATICDPIAHWLGLTLLTKLKLSIYISCKNDNEKSHATQFKILCSLFKILCRPGRSYDQIQLTRPQFRFRI